MNKMDSAIFLLGYIQLFLFCGVSAKPPNIVFIIADDLGFNDVGYHNPDIKSPNIDKLAQEGVRLENYYVQPICTPSRSQLMTGRYQIHTGLQHSVIFAPQRLCLPLDEVTLPEKLKDVGYATHIVGKWHLGFYKEECLPTNRGFDTHYGYYCGKQDYYTKDVCGYFGGWKYSNKFCGFDFHDNLTPDWAANATYSAFLYGKRAEQVVLEHDQTRPLFLYLPFQSVHFPLEAPESYIRMYPNIKDKNRQIFSAMVTAMDDAIGWVLQALEKTGMMEDTVIVFSTDNGGQSMQGGNNWPLRGRKATLWEGGIRGVGVVHGAGIMNPDRDSKELFHVSDWFPTLLHIAGGSTEGTKPLDGHDVWSAIADPAVASPRKEVLHNIDPIYGGASGLKPFPNKHGIDTTKGHTALRVGKWKLLTGDPGYGGWNPVPELFKEENINITELEKKQGQDVDVTSLRLFDVEADPEERSDVASSFPEVVDWMLGRLAEYNATAVPVLWPGPDENCDPAKRGGVWGPWM